MTAILATIDNVVWSIAADTYQTLYLNPAAERVYGRAASAFYADPKLFLNIVHPEDRPQVAGHNLEGSIKSQIISEVSMSNKKVLIVDDDADVRLGFHVLLKANHYDTFGVVDGVSAVSEARKHQPDLIILDLGLPSGGGFIVLEWLRANADLSVIPVIVVSARDLHGNKERALKAGARAYLQKPWNDHELLVIIGQLLGQPELPISQPA